MLSTAAFFISSGLRDAGLERAELVNVSGRQRMLSQRIALCSREAIAAASPETAAEWVSCLEQSTAEFERGHAQIVAVLPRYPDAQAAFRASDMERRVSEFLAKAKRTGPDARAELLRQSAAESKRLLFDLDAVVAAFKGADSTGIVSGNDLVLWVATLLLLCLEAVFIFRPSSYMDLLNDEYGEQLDPDAAKYVSFASDGARRMPQLVQDLLRYARATRQAVEFGPVNLEKVLASVRHDLQARVEDCGGRIEIEPLPTIDAAPTAMHQIFQNLVGNGLKFRRPGVPPVVRVSATQSGNGWRILVADNGIGFEQEHATRIFRPFQRLHLRSKFEGIPATHSARAARGSQLRPVRETLDRGVMMRLRRSLNFALLLLPACATGTDAPAASGTDTDTDGPVSTSSTTTTGSSSTSSSTTSSSSSTTEDEDDDGASSSSTGSSSGSSGSTVATDTDTTGCELGTEGCACLEDARDPCPGLACVDDICVVPLCDADDDEPNDVFGDATMLAVLGDDQDELENFTSQLSGDETDLYVWQCNDTILGDRNPRVTVTADAAFRTCLFLECIEGDGNPIFECPKGTTEETGPVGFLPGCCLDGVGTIEIPSFNCPDSSEEDVLAYLRADMGTAEQCVDYSGDYGC